MHTHTHTHTTHTHHTTHTPHHTHTHTHTHHRLRKQLQHLYIVHPTFWVKTMLRLARPFIRLDTIYPPLVSLQSYLRV